MHPETKCNTQRNIALSAGWQGHNFTMPIVLTALVIWIVYYIVIIVTSEHDLAGSEQSTPNTVEPASSKPDQRLAVISTLPSIPSQPPSHIEKLDDIDTYLKDVSFSLHAQNVQDIRIKLDRIVRLGPDAVPLITAYLNSDRDINFSGYAMGSQIGYATMRLAMFDVLSRVGGEYAEAIWFQELSGNRDPQEIAALATYLEGVAPGIYREEILSSTKAALDAGFYGTQDRDAAPLFRMMAKYGDESVLERFNQMPPLQWEKYSALVMAQLPEGIGIPSLVKFTEGASPSNLGAAFAVKMLAHNAENPIAADALIKSARSNQMSKKDWYELAKILSGTYQIQLNHPSRHIHGVAKTNDEIKAPVSSVNRVVTPGPAGGETLYGVSFSSVTLTQQQMEQRLSLIETLLKETSNQNAKSALSHAYETIWHSYAELMSGS